MWEDPTLKKLFQNLVYGVTDGTEEEKKEYWSCAAQSLPRVFKTRGLNILINIWKFLAAGLPQACIHFRNDCSYHLCRITAIIVKGVTKGHNSPSAEKSQQWHWYFLQCSTFASKRPSVRTWGRQTCFLPQAPSNLVTSLIAVYRVKIAQLSKLLVC